MSDASNIEYRASADSRRLILPRRRDISCKVVGTEALVRDPDTERVHFLNTTAVLVWECCDGITSLQECDSRLRSTFDMPDSTNVQADILEIVENFRNLGLLHA